jgi:hypothetical protein
MPTSIHYQVDQFYSTYSMFGIHESIFDRHKSDFNNENTKILVLIYSRQKMHTFVAVDILEKKITSFFKFDLW